MTRDDVREALPNDPLEYPLASCRETISRNEAPRPEAEVSGGPPEGACCVR